MRNTPWNITEEKDKIMRNKPLKSFATPIKQKFSFSGSELSTQLPESTKFTTGKKTKIQASLKGGVDFGKLNVYSDISVSAEEPTNKRFTGFNLAPSRDRDVPGQTHTTYGNLRQTSAGIGFRYSTGGEKKPSFMATIKGGAGITSTKQDYSTKTSTGLPISTAANMPDGYAGGGPGSYTLSGGTGVSSKPYYKGRIDLGYGKQGPGHTGFNVGGFLETGSEGTYVGLSGRHSMMKAEIKKNIKGGGIIPTIGLTIPFNK